MSVLSRHRVAALLCFEAVETENWTSALGLGAGLERNLTCSAAFGTGSGVHLSLREAFLLALIAAVFATLRSGETALLVKGLLTLGERELRTAVSAGKLRISHKKEEKKEVNCNLPSSSQYFRMTPRHLDSEGVCRSIVLPFSVIAIISQ